MRNIVTCKAVILYLFKTPPPTIKTVLIFVLIQNAPFYSKKAVTTTKMPIKWPNFVFTQNAPPPTSKKAALNFVLIQNAPSYFQKSGYYHKEAHKMTKFLVLIQNDPSYYKNALNPCMPNIVTHTRLYFFYIQNAPLLLKKRY